MDIVNYQEDKDPLSDEELYKVQDYYVERLLKQEKSEIVGYLKYVKGVVYNDKNEVLVNKNGSAIFEFIWEKNKTEQQCFEENVNREYGVEVEDAIFIISNIIENNFIERYYAFKVVDTTTLNNLSWEKNKKGLMNLKDEFIQKKIEGFLWNNEIVSKG